MFGFPKQNKEKGFHHKCNYLQTVTFRLQFPKNDGVHSKESQIIDYLSDKYERKNNLTLNHLDFSIKDGDSQGKTSSRKIGLTFSTVDSAIVYQISEEDITLTIRGSKYTSFEPTINTFLEQSLNVLSLLDVNKLIRASIRKVNHVSFIYDTIKPNIESIKWVFREQYIHNMSNLSSNEYVRAGMSNILMQNNTHLLNLTYGMTYPDKSEGLKTALLDIDIIENDIDTLTNLKKVFTEMNTEIYNIFIDILSKQAVKALDDSTEN